MYPHQDNARGEIPAGAAFRRKEKLYDASASSEPTDSGIPVAGNLR
jgi:hypothetical protein